MGRGWVCRYCDRARGRTALGRTGEEGNNNAMSSIVVVDEHGTVLQRIEKFNFYDIYLLDMGSYVQLDPATSTGYTLAPGGWQLYPFTYRTGG
jgi:hypothetical protein